jgi:hypothetical protein
MTDHYTHFDTRQFTEVREVQTKLLMGKGGKKTGDKKQKAAVKPVKEGKTTSEKQKAAKKPAKAGRKGAASQATA